MEDQLRRAVVTIRSLKREAEEQRALRHAPIAVIGLGCRMAGGADGPEAFWRMLIDGADAIVEVPADRWDADAWFNPDPDHAGTMNTRWGGFLAGIDRFDPGFFELSAREATAMDPQQRLLLEVAWETLEDACLDPGRLNGSATGVYVGINASEYYDAAMARPETLDAHALSGGVASVAAGRLSFLLGFNGPSVAVDTACSSSLTAIHLAVQSLRAGESDLALAGGVYAVLRPNLTVALSKLHMMAPDGRCKSFDAAADGFVQGEGCALVALKRLSDALADGDPIRAVIRGSAANQDGRSGSLTAPSRGAQTQVIRAALADAGLSAERIGYVETHGTGTGLGDPIEIHALADALGRDRVRPVVLGALKSNIGHLGPAAGAAGFVKAALAVEKGAIPGNLHFKTLNPNIELDGFPALFPQGRTGWPEGDGERVAAVSAFGFSGTNVHVVLGEPPAMAPATPGKLNGLAIFAVSGRSAAALDDGVRRCVAVLDDRADLAALARTSLLGRRAFEHRVAVVADSPAQARALLAARVGGGGAPVPLRPRLGVWSAVSAAWTSRLAEWGVVPAATEDGADGLSRLRALGCTMVLTDWDSAEAAGLPRLTGTDARSMATTLAALFEAGVAVDWRLVVGAGPKARLPTYPFQRRSYWRSLDGPAPAVARSLPGERVATPGAEAHFRLPLSLSAFPWLGDHRVHGRALVPGAFQIACLVGAWRARHGAGPCRIEGLTFAHPLALPDGGGIDVWTSLGPDGAARLCTGGADDWLPHADARVSGLAAADAPGVVDLAVLRARCGAVVAPDVWRERLAGVGIHIGPAFQGIQELWSGDGEALARLTLPAILRGTGGGVDGLPHPALLDACLQVAGGALSERLRGEALLPVGIDSVLVTGEAAGELWAHARLTADGAVISADVTVTTATGAPLVTVRGLHVRRAAASAVDGAARLFHQMVWRPAAVGQRPPARFVVADSAQGLAPVLAGLGAIWTPGSGASWTGEVVDLQGWDAAADGDPLALVLPAFALVRQLAALERGGARDLRYTLVARPHQGALRGLAATVALEHPNWRPRCLIADSLDDLAAGLGADPDETLVKIEAGAVQAARLVAMAAPVVEPARLTGAVLISGGLGGLGRRVARWAAERGAASLILVGRNVDGADADAFAAELPCPARRIAVDLAAPAFAEGGAMALLSRLALDGPPLRAIFHAAGAQRPGLLADLSSEAFAEALAAKARGAWALHRATVELGLDLDHFALFSSLAGVLGAAGQGGYGAANAALDGLARLRRGLGLPGASIAWGRFEEAGMATALDAASLARVDALGLRAIGLDAGMEALDRALSAGLTDPVVAAVDWSRFAARHPSGAAPRLVGELVAREKTPVEAAETGPKSDRTAWLASAAAAILGADRADVALDRPLSQLGLDSLMAVELRNRIAAVWGTAPSIALLLGGASLADVAAALQPAPDAQAPESEEWEELTL